MPGALHKLGVGKMDAALVCFHEKLAESVIVTHILTRLRVRNIICLVADEKHEKILQKLGATEVIFPERNAAFAIVQSLLKRAS
jgi:trk system potassium uptake protein TrkA